MSFVAIQTPLTFYLLIQKQKNSNSSLDKACKHHRYIQDIEDIDLVFQGICPTVRQYINK